MARLRFPSLRHAKPQPQADGLARRVHSEEPRILRSEDGLAIPDEVANDVLAIGQHGGVTIYCLEGRAEHPAVETILWAIRRRGIAPENIRKVALSPEKFDDIISQHRDATQHLVSFERKLIQFLVDCAEEWVTDAILKQYPNSAGVERRIDGNMTPGAESYTKETLENLCSTLFHMSDPESRTGDYSPSEPLQASIVTGLPKYGLQRSLSAVRLQFNPTFFGPECEIRLQYAGRTARPLDEIGLAAPALINCRRGINSPGGASFFSGPMGSGKTNLQVSAIRDYHSLHPEDKIITIEHPPEIFIAPRVSQWAVNDGRNVDVEYRSLLGRSLRSDAQVVMLQELREPTAAAAFMELALTGVRALTSIHTTSAQLIPRRLANWNIPRVNVTDSEIMRLLGAVRLVPVLCDCKIPVRDALADSRYREELRPTIDNLRAYAAHAYPLRGAPIPDVLNGFVRDPEGCAICRSRSRFKRLSYGTQDRMQIAEMIVPDVRLLEQLWEGQHLDAQVHLRKVLRVPALAEDAIDRIAAGTLCPLDAEHKLGSALFRVDADYAGQALSDASEEMGPLTPPRAADAAE